MVDPSDRRWDRLSNQPAIAIKHLQVWSVAVTQQADRVLDVQRGDRVREVDAYLFAQALRQVLRAAEMYADTLTDTGQQGAARAAVERFTASVPAAKDVRDILDHFDDYARGLGRLAHLGTRPRDRTPSEETAMQFEPRCELSPAGGCVLHCGDRSLDVGAAREASDRLAADLYEVSGLVERDPDDAFASFGPYTADNPAAVAFALYQTLTKDSLDADDLEQLRQRVTPESLPAWGDFSDCRRMLDGYSLASKPHYVTADIVNIKLPADFDQTRMATTEVPLLGVQWMTLQRRPDLDGTWYMHSVGAHPWPPETMPQT